MNHHNLKILPEHYNNVKNGTKTFEIRVNDRAFQKGDKVTLYKWHKDLVDKPIDWLTSEGTPALNFTIGDVYSIDSERVVFSLLKSEARDE